MLFILLFSGLLYLSYQKNQTVTNESFRTYWFEMKKKPAPQTSIINTLINKVIPIRVPDFDLHDYTIASIVTIRDSGDVYLGWLGFWIQIQNTSSVNKSLDKSATEVEKIDAKAHEALDLANAAKKTTEYAEAARHFIQAASYFSQIASSDTGTTLDAIRAYEQGSSCYAHDSVNNQKSVISALESARDLLAQSSSTSLDTHRKRILSRLSEVYIKSNKPSLALEIIDQLPWESSVPLQVQRATVLVQLDKFSDARTIYRNLAREVVSNSSSYQFRVGEFILDMILCGLTTRWYSKLLNGLEDGDEVSGLAWSSTRERSFIQALSDLVGESHPSKRAHDPAQLTNHLDSWHAMLNGWRSSVIQSWLMREHPSLLPIAGISTATAVNKASRRSKK